MSSEQQKFRNMHPVAQVFAVGTAVFMALVLIALMVGAAGLGWRFVLWAWT